MNLTLAKPELITTTRKLIVRGGNFIAKQSPVILAGTAIVGVGTTAYLATKAGIKANEMIEQAKYEKGGEELDFKEKVQASWKAYVPTIISGGLTIGAIVASSAISQRRQAALAGLYALSEGALKEYQEKVEKELGSKTAQSIKDEINADSVRNQTAPEVNGTVTPGDVLCKDKLSGRFFMANPEKIRRAENDLNHAILGGDMCASLNEFYSLIGLDEIGFGDDIGWNIDVMCRLAFTSALTSDAKPVLVIDFQNGGGPTYRYRDI